MHAVIGWKIIESEISEQASRQVVTEEPNQALSTCQAP